MGGPPGQRRPPNGPGLPRCSGEDGSRFGGPVRGGGPRWGNPSPPPGSCWPARGGGLVADAGRNLACRCRATAWAARTNTPQATACTIRLEKSCPRSSRKRKASRTVRGAKRIQPTHSGRVCLSASDSSSEFASIGCAVNRTISASQAASTISAGTSQRREAMDNPERAIGGDNITRL